MKKALLLLLSISLLSSVLMAQEHQKVEYLRNDGSRVSMDNKPDFVRIIKEPDAGSSYSIYQEFYISGDKKAVGMISKYEPIPMYEGKLETFYKDGTLQSVVNYSDGIPDGDAVYYFSNAAVKKKVQHIKSSKEFLYLNPFSQVLNLQTAKVIYQADSLNQVMVKDGSGHAVESAVAFGKPIIEEGNYKNGLKEGLWVAKDSSGGYWYKENFKQGELVSGESGYDGVSYKYTNIEELPMYKAGMEKFNIYFNQGFPAPPAPYNKTVLYRFIVDRDGKLTDIKIDRKGFYKPMYIGVLRALIACENWNPAKQHGIPVPVTYFLAVPY